MRQFGREVAQHAALRLVLLAGVVLLQGDHCVAQECGVFLERLADDRDDFVALLRCKAWALRPRGEAAEQQRGDQKDADEGGAHESGLVPVAGGDEGGYGTETC